jgi:REP element-mobilizing transposase RayT
MTRKWHNQNLPGALHYLTGNVINRIQIFQREDCCKGFLEVLSDQLKKWPSKLIAYVIMPDHFHLMLNPRDGDIQGLGGALKSLSAKKIVELTGGRQFRLKVPDKDGSTHQVWQESFKAFPLWSGWMIKQKINYIHSNPVRAKLVNSAKDYPWSSFTAFYWQDQNPLPVDTDWWWPDDAEKLSKAQKELGWRIYSDHYKTENQK